MPDPIATPPDPKGFLGVLLAVVTALAWTITELVRFFGDQGRGHTPAQTPTETPTAEDPLYKATRRDIERLERVVTKLGHDVAFIKGTLSKRSKSDQEGF